jgi:hypothetical protein
MAARQSQKPIRATITTSAIASHRLPISRLTSSSPAAAGPRCARR